MGKEQTRYDSIEHEASKLEALSKVEMSERRHDAWSHAVETFRRPAYYGTELEATNWKENA